MTPSLIWINSVLGIRVIVMKTLISNLSLYGDVMLSMKKKNRNLKQKQN